MDEKLIRKRKNAKSVIYPRIGKIIRVTFRTGEGRKMRTDYFLISNIDETVVRLDEVSWNSIQQMLAPVGRPFAVNLERVHFIRDGDKGVWPREG